MSRMPTQHGYKGRSHNDATDVTARRHGSRSSAVTIAGFLRRMHGGPAV
jgi:hypothetical protein